MRDYRMTRTYSVTSDSISLPRFTETVLADNPAESHASGTIGNLSGPTISTQFSRWDAAPDQARTRGPDPLHRREAWVATEASGHPRCRESPGSLPQETRNHGPAGIGHRVPHITRSLREHVRGEQLRPRRSMWPARIRCRSTAASGRHSANRSGAPAIATTAARRESAGCLRSGRSTTASAKRPVSASDTRGRSRPHQDRSGRASSRNACRPTSQQGGRGEAEAKREECFQKKLHAHNTRKSAERLGGCDIQHPPL